ncbi:hypothetical protein, partial [Muribaculum intestinale]
LFLWSFYKWGVLLALLLIGMNFGMNALIWSIVASNVNIFLTNAFLSRKWVGIGIFAIARAVLPAGLLSTALLCALMSLSWLGISLHWAIQAAIFATLYIAGACTLRLRAVNEALDMMRRLKSA